MGEGKRYNDFQHALSRPDCYVGSIRTSLHERWFFSKAENKMMFGNLNYAEGLERIFFEILSNAIDNLWRSQVFGIPMKEIRISLDKETGYCKIWNDGSAIQVKKKDYEYTDEMGETTVSSFYPAELFFGLAKTSTNYQDSEERKTSGRNGLGAKLTNVFSKHFIVRCFDPQESLIFHQEYFDNLTRRTVPVLEKCTKKRGWTEISFLPDFERFGVSSWPEDILSRVEKSARDASLVTNLCVFLNEEKIYFSNLLEYSKLFSSGNSLLFSSADSSFALVEKEVFPPSFESTELPITFINGLEVLSGVHVNLWKKSVLLPILKAFNLKQKTEGKPKATVKQLECFFQIFIVCELDKPEFTSQTKHELSSPSPKTTKISPEQVKKVLKWNWSIELSSRLEPQTRARKAKKLDIDFTKVEDAQFAGTDKSSECTLLLCEGNSAKSLCVAGFTCLEDRAKYGAFALKGKVLNTTNASQKTMNKNKELELLTNVLGLSKDLKKTLRYGRVMLMCDADLDGIHIEGLVLNFFHKHYPSLLENKFVVSLRTPILKAFPTKKKELWFYSLTEFDKWTSENPGLKGLKVKYLKGLGSSQAEHGKKYLKDQKLIEYTINGTEKEKFELAFSKSFSDKRKEWLEKVPELNEQSEGELPMGKFIDERLALYHRANNRRSIPCVFDGLKPSQRKVLFACLQGNIIGENKSTKMERLAGQVASVSGYHHGEISLTNTIIGMAQNFVGSGNNLPLLFSDGMFGSRLQGGKDHSAARYLSTYLFPIVRAIFHPDDDDLYERILEDNERNEPLFYLPTVPLVLCNSCAGIGTGHSTEIPPYNPVDLCFWIDCWLDNKPLPKLVPFWRGFKGTVTLDDEDKPAKGKTTGKLEKLSKRKWLVNELPVSFWTYDYKKFLKELEENKHISGFTDLYNDEDACFEILPTRDFTPTSSNLKLSKSFSFKNMRAIDENGKVQKFETVQDILVLFCTKKLELYTKRKEKILGELLLEIRKQENKYRFLSEVLSSSINIKDKEEKLVIVLQERKYDKINDGYEYLLSLPVRSMTLGRMQDIYESLKKLKEKEDQTREKKETQMWKEDLAVFERLYKKMKL